MSQRTSVVDATVPPHLRRRLLRAAPCSPWPARFARLRARAPAMALVALAGWLLSCVLPFGIVTSESVGAHVGLVQIGAPVRVGDLAYYAYPGTPLAAYQRGYAMVHFVAGLPGDRVENIDGTIFVAGNPMGAVQSRGPLVGELSPIALPGESFVIPNGFLYVSSPLPTGYDSRYAQHNLVPAAAVRGRVFKLF